MNITHTHTHTLPNRIRILKHLKPNIPQCKLTFLVLDLGLDIFDGVRRLDLKGDGLARQGLHKDLHFRSRSRGLE